MCNVESYSNSVGAHVLSMQNLTATVTVGVRVFNVESCRYSVGSCVINAESYSNIGGAHV